MRRRANRSEIIARLRARANALYDARADMRAENDMLHTAYDELDWARGQ